MNLIVLFGGVSSEHEISCISASYVIRHLSASRYQVYAVGITCEGRWYLYENADPDKIENGTWEEEELVPAILSPDRATHGLLLTRGEKVESLYADCLFPVLHGKGGEDGTIQGLAFLAGIPCVGCDTAASANSLDKSLTKIIAAHAGVKQAAFHILYKKDFLQDPLAVCSAVEQTLGQYPVFAKAAQGGSSVGVVKATDRASLQTALKECFYWDDKVIVEEFIHGHEIEVAVLGNHTQEATVAGEIAPAQEFYTYDAKYHDASSTLYIPAHISDHAMDTVRQSALTVYQALGCRGLARVDFFCTYDKEEIIFNEINTMPGFTSISMYPKLWDYQGLSYPDLLDRLIGLALEDAHG